MLTLLPGFSAWPYIFDTWLFNFNKGKLRTKIKPSQGQTPQKEASIK